jgi:DNA-binding response OmpR family regulator
VEERGLGNKILIVDDERTLVRTLKELLLFDLPQLEVDEAYSGEEALSLMAGSSYDLIIADLRMPGVDGLELIQGVRYLDPAVPIILMTAFGSEAVRDRALQLGVNCYIPKPFEADEMLQAVGECLSKRRRAGA